MDNVSELYTEEVRKHIYQVKSRLPSDFPLITRVEYPYIVLVVEMQHFDFRPVEDRLAIAIELEKLKSLIEGTGVGCLIEKPR